MIKADFIMNKKRGFTLIELLITIAIMLSVLGIAIVAFVNISSRKKEESFEKVKEQVVNAAEQYFETNKYLFDGLTTGGATGTISLGKLTSEGYLNKVTDPRTRKALSPCTIVEVTKKDGGYEVKLNEESINSSASQCDSDNSVVVTETGGPKIEVTVASGKLGKEQWYQSNVVLKVEGISNKNGAIKEISSCDGSACNNFDVKVQNNTIYNDDRSYVSDTSSKTTCYQVKNVNNKVAKKCMTLKIDKTPPLCSVSPNIQPSATGWYNANTKAPNLTFTGSDALSGIAGETKIIKSSTGNGTHSYTFSDKAGNTKTCSYQVKYDGAVPTCTLAASKQPNGNNGWYNKNTTQVDLALEKSSDVTSWHVETSKNTIEREGTYVNVGQNLYVTGEGYHYVKATITDQAGNQNTCKSKVIKIDNTPPTVYDTSHGVVKCYDANKQSKHYGFSIYFQDNLSYTTVRYKYYSCETSYGSWVSVNGQYPPAFTSKDNKPNPRDKTVKTNFVGCGNNALGFIYELTDNAGNVVTREMKVAKGSGRTSTGNKYCNTDAWWYDPKNK